MEKQESSLDFTLMAWTFKLRDLIAPRINILKEAEIKPGDTVLDYGCGPGSYIVPAAKLAGNSGKVFALDINPLAIGAVENIAKKNNLTNVKTILSDCRTGLEDNSVDVILLYDTFHDLKNRDEVLEELRRILKKGGVLSFSDHHLPESEITSRLAPGSLFQLIYKSKRTYSFSKV